MRLVRAVARREVLAGYEIVPGDGEADGLAVVETWRGPRFAAHVVVAGTGTGAGPNAGADAPDAAALAGTMSGGGARVAAVWLAPPGTGRSGRRLAVVVTEAVSGAAAAGEAR